MGGQRVRVSGDVEAVQEMEDQLRGHDPHDVRVSRELSGQRLGAWTMEVVDDTGPNGEDREPHLKTRCPGGELERTPVVEVGSRSGKHSQARCRYCWNSNSAKRVRKNTTYQCSKCKTPLCVTCSHRYHQWVNS